MKHIVRMYSVMMGFSLMLPFFLNAQSAQLTPEEVVNLRMVTTVSIQPQGNFIAYTLSVPRSPDEKPGSNYSELWLVPTGGGASRVYIRKPHSVSSVQWMPDGRTITFLSKRTGFDKHRQVYAIPLDGGEAAQLSHAPRDISRYALSPDGTLLAYIMRDATPDSVKAARKQGFDQSVEDTWSTINRIYVENLRTGESYLVTRGKEHVWEFRWTPGGKNLIYRASLRPFTDDSYMLTDNYIVSVPGGDGKKLLDTEGKITLAKASPDGKYYAWLGAVSFNDPFPGSLFLLKKGSNQPVNLLENYNGTGEAFWWQDNRTILLETLEDVQKVLYEVRISDGRMKKLSPRNAPIFSRLSFTKDMKRFAAIGNTATHPDEVFFGKTGRNRWLRLTHSNPVLEKMTFGEQEVIHWTGPDGWEISGILVKPVGYREGQSYPLQVQVHGGPEGARLNGWNTYYSRWVQMLAQHGIMVLLPNYRGSIGKGVAFAKGDHNDLMGKEFEDILAGIDYLVDRGMVDPERVGIGGGSYGGYASAWAATRYSERFAAAVVFVGISNQISKAGMSDIPMENAVVHWNQWLYDDFDFTWERSPLKYIKHARTPTLILHGKEDKRVPLNQAYELYRGLKFVKTPTQLVVYPREGHGNRERAHRLDVCRRGLEWYLRYLLDTKGNGKR